MKRRIWQIVSTVLHNAYLPGFAGITIYQGFLKGGCTPGLNCYACPGAFMSCPIGVMQNFAVGHQFPFFLVGFLGLVGMAVGRMTCGWICPFGFLQDMMKKLSSRVIHLPRWTGYLKFVSLVLLAIALPVALGEMWFSKLCPAGAIEAAIPWAVAGTSDSPDMAGFDVRSMIGTFFWIKMAVLAFFLVSMIFVKRIFCRTMCPLGAVFALFNRISVVRLRLDRDDCVSCGFCNDSCPVDLEVLSQVETSPECIRCLECTKCPRGAISVRFGLGG
jgi:polyferredoxin